MAEGRSLTWSQQAQLLRDGFLVVPHASQRDVEDGKVRATIYMLPPAPFQELSPEACALLEGIEDDE